jgi:hypothetical protein
MAKTPWRWTEDDNAKLRSLAGTKSPREVAAELGRSVGALTVQASKLKVSVPHKKARRASTPAVLTFTRRDVRTFRRSAE